MRLPPMHPCRKQAASNACQVPACKCDLTSCYCKRRHICKRHLEAEAISCDDAFYRFCLQCGKLEPISCFDGIKRSCRATLLKRRTKLRTARAAPVAHQAHGGGSMTPLGDGSCMPLDSLFPVQCAAPMPQQMELPPCWDSAARSSGSAGTGPLCACVPAACQCSPAGCPGAGVCSPFATASQRAFSPDGIDASDSDAAGCYLPMPLQLLPPVQPLLLAQPALLPADPFDDVLQEMLAEELARAIVRCRGCRGSEDDDGSGRDGQTLTRSNSLESSNNATPACCWDVRMLEADAAGVALCAP